MRLIPTSTNLLLEVHEGRSSDIILPAGATLQPFAIVRAIGDKCTLGYKVKDKVLCNPSLAVYTDEIDGAKLCIVNESSIFALVDFSDEEKQEPIVLNDILA